MILPKSGAVFNKAWLDFVALKPTYILSAFYKIPNPGTPDLGTEPKNFYFDQTGRFSGQQLRSNVNFGAIKYLRRKYRVPPNNSAFLVVVIVLG